DRLTEPRLTKLTNNKSVDGSVDAPLSLSEFAAGRGLSRQAVTKAVQRGRLKNSVVMVGGRPRLVSREAAEAEWRRNTHPLRGGKRPVLDQQFTVPAEDFYAGGYISVSKRAEGVVITWTEEPRQDGRRPEAHEVALDAAAARRVAQWIVEVAG